jgi:hypothetical protein
MLMFTNADCTVYFSRNGGFIRQAITDVFWSESRQSNVLKTGLTSADAVKLMIPISSANDLIFTQGKDIVMKGIIDFDFDNTSQKTVSDSRRSLELLGTVYTINMVDDKRYGNTRMKHWDLSCK